MFALLDPKVWIAFALAIVITAGAAAGAVFFWHLGKAEEIKLLAHAEGYGKGVSDSYEEYKRGAEVAKKFVAKKKRAKVHYQAIALKLEKLTYASPQMYRPGCDLSDDRVQLLNDALSGAGTASGADGEVRPPSAPDQQDAAGVRPGDDREREAGARVRGQDGVPAGVDHGD